MFLFENSVFRNDALGQVYSKLSKSDTVEAVDAAAFVTSSFTMSAIGMARSVGECRILVKALTPICMTNFQTAANAPTKLGELKKIGTWARESFIREGKWAEIDKEQVTSVVDACADALYKL